MRIFSRARLAFQTASDRRYKGIVDAGRKIFAEEGGFRGLYRGIAPTCMGMIPYAGTSFSVFDRLKMTALDAIPELAAKEDNPALLNAQFKLICGASAGLAAQTLAYPFDVARRRMQLAMMSHELDKIK